MRMKRHVHISRYSSDLIRMPALHQAVDKTSAAVVNFKAYFIMNGSYCLAGNETMGLVTGFQINTVSSWLLHICLLRMVAVDTLRLRDYFEQTWQGVGEKDDNSLSSLSNIPTNLSADIWLSSSSPGKYHRIEILQYEKEQHVFHSGFTCHNENDVTRLIREK